MENRSVIEAHGITKTFLIDDSKSFLSKMKSIFKPKYKILTAVNNLYLNINQGEAVAFIGSNGSGKSTTIKMLSGILTPTLGSIKIMGLDPFEARTEVSRVIGTVFGQKSQMWYHLPPIDTFDLNRDIYNLDYREYKDTLEYLVDTFKISDFLYSPVRKLSLGQRMKCEIVAALLHKPKILFLDEPTIGLDIIAKQQVRDELRRLNETAGISIFLTSHDISDLEAIANRTVIIDNGKIIFDDKTENLKRLINWKIVDIISQDPIVEFQYDGARVLELDEFKIKVEVEKSAAKLQQFVDYAFAHLQIKDINIQDMPLEEIISNIYQKTPNR